MIPLVILSDEKIDRPKLTVKNPFDHAAPPQPNGFETKTTLRLYVEHFERSLLFEHIEQLTY